MKIRDTKKGGDETTAKVDLPTYADEMRFGLGNLAITTVAWECVDRDDLVAAIDKHLRGDWGDVSKEDWTSNELALKEGYRLISSFKDRTGTKFWIITEADRSLTTILLPDEY